MEHYSQIMKSLRSLILELVSNFLYDIVQDRLSL